MGQQPSTQTDGTSAFTSSHSSTASSSPPSTQAETSDMRSSSVWGNNSNAALPSVSSRSDREFGDHPNVRPKAETEVTRMSIRAVIDTFIENCLSANSDNSQSGDKPLDRFHINGGSYIQCEDTNDDNESLLPRDNLAMSKDGSDCPPYAADCEDDVKPSPNIISSELNEIDRDRSLTNSNSQTEQPEATQKNVSQFEPPVTLSKENSLQLNPTAVCGSQGKPSSQTVTCNDNSGSDKNSSESDQAVKNKDHSSSMGNQPKTSERQTFSAYLQERLKTIDLDKHEELTQLALSKDIQCQGQMFMWEMVKKPIDDYDSSNQSKGSLFTSGPVKLQTVIDRVLDKSLLNQDQPLGGRGRENISGEEYQQNVNPSGSAIQSATTSTREKLTQEIQGPAPVNTPRLCFKDHIEKVLLENFLSFEEEEKAEALKAETQSKSQALEASDSKISKSTSARALNEADKASVSSRIGGNKLQENERHSTRSASAKMFVETEKLNKNVNNRHVDTDRLSKGVRSSTEMDRVKNNKGLVSDMDVSGCNRLQGEIGSENLNKDVYHMASNERERLSINIDGSISVQDIVDQVINQTEMMSRLLTPSTKDTTKLSTSSSDSSAPSIDLSSQPSPGLRYQDSTHNRSLLEAQRHVVHKEHQSSTTLGRKRGRPRLGSPVNMPLKSSSDNKQSHLDSRYGLMTAPMVAHPHTSQVVVHPHTSQVMAHPHTSQVVDHPHTSQVMAHQHTSQVVGHPHTAQVVAHPHTSLPSKDYFMTNHFPPGFSHLSPHVMRAPGISAALRPPITAILQQGQDLKSPKSLAAPSAGHHLLQSHDTYHHQQHQGHHYSIHQPHDNPHISSPNVHPQQIQIDQTKDNISSSNRIVSVSHIPTKSCSCHACIAHFSQRKSPPQFLHVQQQIHPHPFSKLDSFDDQIHHPAIHHPSQAMMTHMGPSDFNSRPISPTKNIQSPAIAFSGQTATKSAMPALLSVQTFQKDLNLAPHSNEMIPSSAASVGYSSGHYQPHDQLNVVQANMKSHLYDPRYSGIQVEHCLAEPLQKVGKDLQQFVSMEAPKFETNPIDGSVEGDLPLDLSVKSSPSLRSSMDNNTDRLMQSSQLTTVDQGYILPLPGLSTRAEVSTQLEQQTSSSHHLQKLENSVDRFLLHRHAPSQLHVSLYSSPMPHASLYPQPPSHFSQHRLRSTQSDGLYHGGNVGENIPQEVLGSRAPNSPGHTSHCPSPATPQMQHQMFAHPTAVQPLPHHRLDIIESLPAEQYQTNTVVVDSLPRTNKDTNQIYTGKVTVVAADYQRPSSHNLDSRQECATSMENAAVVSSPSSFHNTPSPDDNQKLSFCKHEPIQNIIGNHSPNDILYLICRICKQTYGSPYGFRKHFRNQHGFEPKADHTVIQTISATKTAMAHTEPPEASKRAIQQLQSTKDNKEVYLHDQLVKTSPSQHLASRLYCIDSASLDESKLDLLKELPPATKCLECLECGQTFQLNDFGSYKRHCRQHSLHRSSGPFACHDCERSFSEPSHLQEHLATHSSFTPSVCGICRTFFSSPTYLAGHLLAAHGVGTDRHVDVVDTKPIDSMRKCVSEPVIIIDKSTSYSDVTILSPPSTSGSKMALSSHSATPSTSDYVAFSTSNISAKSSSQCSTPSTSNANTISPVSTQSLPASSQSLPASSQSAKSSANKEVLTRPSLSLSSLLSSSKHRFAKSSENSQMFTVHTPKGLEIQKLPADAVVTSASPDSSYDEAKLLCVPLGYHSDVTSNEGVCKSGEAISNSNEVKITSENSPIKIDNLEDDKRDDAYDLNSKKYDRRERVSALTSVDMSRETSSVSSQKLIDSEKFYQHKKYSRHRKRMNECVDTFTESKHQKVTDKTDGLPFLVSSTINSDVTVQDCQSSCSYSEDSSLSWTKSSELSDKILRQLKLEKGIENASINKSKSDWEKQRQQRP